MKVHRFVSNDFSVRIAAVNATNVVAEMQKIQGCSLLAAMGVGRTMVGALLMAASLKPGQEVGILLKGNGPLGSLYAQANHNGQVRGYCPNPSYEAPDPEDVLNLKKALGFGHLTVSRQQPFQKQAYTGTVEMVSGEVGEDLAHYLKQSHQIRSLISLGVYFDIYGKAQAAGGILIEVMPGVEEEIVSKIQDNAEKQTSNISKLIFSGAQPLDLIKPYMEGVSFTQIPHDFELSYFCPCNLERVVDAIRVLGEEEIQEMLEQNNQTQVQCQMCGRNYEIPNEKLEQLKMDLRKNSMH